jgi:DNA-binding NtrC family response regulator
LRERNGDIELLAQQFLNEQNVKQGTRKLFSRRSMEIIRNLPWQGNVRELKNVVLRAYILAGETIALDDYLPEHHARKPAVQEGCLNFFIGTPLADAQREIIQATLKHFDGNKRMTADTLGISLKTLYNRLKEY